MREILRVKDHFGQIDASYPVPTGSSEGPKAVDLVTALQAGYEFTKDGDKGVLATAIRIPAWFDYDPEFVKAPEKPDSSTPIFWVEDRPQWEHLLYTLPKGYQWKAYLLNKNDSKSPDVYALVPDGYELDRDDNGNLKREKGHYVLVKSGKTAPPHLVHGTRRNDSWTITDARDFDAKDVGRRIVGKGIPSGTTIRAVNANSRTATMSVNATEDSNDTMSIGDVDQISYADKVVSGVWPVTKDYFYVELRRGEVGEATAKRACFPQPDEVGRIDPVNNVVCGYLKIGNLLQIMQRLADMACPYQDKESIDASCSQSNFGIADNLARIPSWAQNSAPYEGLTGRLTGPYIYEPAHNPDWDSDRAKRDRDVFFNLYTLYQMSLVDTSKLVTGAPSITIPK